MNKEQVINRIKEIDQAYQNGIRELGVEGWLKYLSDDIIICTSGHRPSVVGIKDVKERFIDLYKTYEVDYSWEVDGIHVSDDLSLAYVYTRFKMQTKSKTLRQTIIGKDCFIYKRVNGDYKICFLIGNRE